ncbi:BQ2448_7977 [Microbotryum intermedium]|uniref:RING-type E3 ubiquitin transferase n=1 Tax=Microbotryum intermedium TaxID=269621 RepID=A0A238FUQ3_9BASI|nr:BQ2448_7977 [Microbotryum intermedium]
MMALLFFIMSSGNDGMRERVTDESTFDTLRSSLKRKEDKRDGLADWLHVDRYNRTLLDAKLNMTGISNDSTIDVIEFVPKEAVNEVLRSEIEAVVRRQPTEQGRVYYHQNLTGMARGNWKMETGWTFEKLGLQETWNVTTRQRVDSPEAAELKDEATSEDGLSEQPEVEATAQEAVQARSRKRQIEAPETEVPVKDVTWENVTTVMNRTDLRNKFAFETGGRVLLDLREYQSTAPGAIIASTESGQLLRIDPEARRQEWEQVGPTTFLRGEITLTDADKIEEARFDIEAVHYLEDGTMVGYATPSWVRSHMFDLVGLAKTLERRDGEQWKQLAAGHTMLKELDRRIAREREDLEEAIESESQRPEEEKAAPQGPQCIFTFYGSLAPLPHHYSAPLYAEYYASLWHPTGSSLKPPPPPQITYMLYSENCGLVLSGQAELVTTPRLWEYGTTFAVLMGFTQMLMAWVLARQMDKAAPGHAGKVAYFTIGVQTSLDAYFFVTAFTVALVTDTRASLPFMVPAFFALISSLIFSMRYATEIRNATPPPPSRPAQPPPPPPPTVEELAARAAERRAAAEAAGAGNDDDATAASPLLATATTTTPSTAAPGEVSDSYLGSPVSLRIDFDREPWLIQVFGNPLVGIGISIALAFGAIVWFFGWVVLITLLAYSYWIPQIIVNVQRGAARGSLRREYVIVTTLGRLVMPCYFWGYKDNVFAIETTPWVMLLVLYTVGQAAILVLQDSRFGARFFLPTRAIEAFHLAELETWDYHPVPSTLDLETSVSAISPCHSEDCPICLSSIQIHPTKEEEGDPGARNKLRWSYMVPPCHHLMHTECMESWIAVKSVCPICRARLPSL